LGDFFAGTPVSSTNKTDRHNIAEILLKVALNTIAPLSFILKLKTYGVSPSALNLIDSYLKNRKQCVKEGPHISNWQDIYKGVPQVS
jgi:hypothetical protein